jgi:hypothetical protein
MVRIRRPPQRTGQVGRALATLAESRDIVRVTVERLRQDPLMFLWAPARRCDECDLARASVQAERGSFVLTKTNKPNLSLLLRAWCFAAGRWRKRNACRRTFPPLATNPVGAAGCK